MLPVKPPIPVTFRWSCWTSQHGYRRITVRRWRVVGHFRFTVKWCHARFTNISYCAAGPVLGSLDLAKPGFLTAIGLFRIVWHFWSYLAYFDERFGIFGHQDRATQAGPRLGGRRQCPGRHFWWKEGIANGLSRMNLKFGLVLDFG